MRTIVTIIDRGIEQTDIHAARLNTRGRQTVELQAACQIIGWHPNGVGLAQQFLGARQSQDISCRRYDASLGVPARGDIFGKTIPFRHLLHPWPRLHLAMMQENDIRLTGSNCPFCYGLKTPMQVNIVL